MPWIYELGLELYRLVELGSPVAFKRGAARLRQVVEFTVSYGLSKEMDEMLTLLFHLLDRIEQNMGGERRKVKIRTARENGSAELTKSSG
jgi:hypothetical protein